MPNFRKIAPGAYLVAFMLVIIPVFDSLMQVAPWFPSISQWRFGAVGLLSNALFIPAAGTLIAVATAVMSDHAWAKRWIGRLSWLVAILCVLTFLLFALDAVQSASKLLPGNLLSYRVAVATSTVKMFLGGAAFALMGMACGVPAPRAPKASKAPPRAR